MLLKSRSLFRRVAANRRETMLQDLRRTFRFEPLESRNLLAGVTTDLPDYEPGATAQITASEFSVGETVQFQVLHQDGNNGGAGHDPWLVTDGSPEDADGAEDGNV